MVVTPIIEYWPNGNKQQEVWYLNDVRHREDGPADISYYKSGKIECEYWFNTGKLHRIDGPAYIWYYETGETIIEIWQVNGKESNHKEWLIDNNLYKPYSQWTGEEKVLWRLRWI